MRCGWRVEWVRDLDPDDRKILIKLLTSKPDPLAGEDGDELDLTEPGDPFDE